MGNVYKPIFSRTSLFLLEYSQILFLSSLTHKNAKYLPNFSMNIKKSLCLILITCLILNLSQSAEGLSVKLQGKLALAGILSGVAYLTHTLVKRDMHAAEDLQTQLGPPERIIQFERGFDQWDVHYYREHSYFFLNNRFIRKKTHKAFFLNQASSDLELIGQGFFLHRTRRSDNPFSLTYKPFSMNPRWLSLYPLPQQRVPQPVSFYPRLLEDGRLLVLLQRHPFLK